MNARRQCVPGRERVHVVSPMRDFLVFNLDDRAKTIVILHARWRLELIRCRAGESADFEVEACDAKGRPALPSNLVQGAQKEIGRRVAS